MTNLDPTQTAVVDRRRMRGRQSRQRVLEHAAAIASVDGLEGLTIGRLATEAGIAKGNIQVLFGDKQALQLATIEYVNGLYGAAIVEPALAEASPVRRLTAMVSNWFDFVESRRLPGGCFMNAVSSEFRARPGVVRDRVAERRAEKRARYVKAIGDAQDLGEIVAGVDADQLAFELLAFQALANVALTIGDAAEFARARTSSLQLIASVSGAEIGRTTS